MKTRPTKRRNCLFFSQTLDEYKDWIVRNFPVFIPKEIHEIVWEYLLPSKLVPNSILIKYKESTQGNNAHFYKVLTRSHCKKHGWVLVCKVLGRFVTKEL